MKIETIEQLMAMPTGSRLFKVENNDVREYTVCCNYPSKYIQSTLIAYGTNDGCSKWIGRLYVSTGKLFTEYPEAVDKLLSDMESDIEAVKRLYISNPLTHTR